MFHGARSRRRFPLKKSSADSFDCDGCGFATADAKRGDAAAEIALLERREQRDEDARAGCADGMAERAGATVDVDFVVGQTEVAHGSHDDNGEGLVDFEQVDIRKRPARAFKQHADSADGRGGKERGSVGVGGVGRDGGKRFEAATIGFGSAHEDKRGGSVGDGAGICGGDRSTFAKGGLEVGNFVGSGFEREFVVGDDPVNLGAPAVLAAPAVLPAVTVRGTISAEKLPSAVAFCARVRDASANSSCACRENA